MKILCVNGSPRVGKDLFCKYAYENRGMVYSYSTIDEVKKLALQLGWDGQKDAKGRKFLSDLKDALTTYSDLPRKYVLEQIEQILTLYKRSDNSDVIFLVQMREPAEIERWKNLHGARSVCITRDDATMVTEWGNHADDETMFYHYDYYLTNASNKEAWKEKSVNFIDKIRKEKWESRI